MYRTLSRLVPILIAFLVVSVTRADQSQSAALQQLKADFPGVGVYVTERLTLIYGKAMSAGETPSEAINTWLGSYSAALAGAGVMVEQSDEGSPLADDRFTRFLLRQTAGGVPVYGRVVSVLVLNGGPPRVSYVGARLAKIGAWQPESPNVDASEATAIVNADPNFGHLEVWSQPELLVYVDGPRGDADPRLIWRIEGSSSAESAPAAFSFYIDALTGEVLAVNDLVVSADVSGVVRAWVTDTTAVPPAGEGVGAIELNPVALRPLRGLRVQIAGGPSVFTDANGGYSFDGLMLSPPWTVQASLANGEFVNVLNNGAAPLSLSASAGSSGAIVDFTFNPATQDPNNTAQTNAFWVINETRAWLAAEGLGLTFASPPVSVNEASYIGNAAFNSGVIQSGKAACSTESQPCRNSAYSTWLSHEYGHYVQSLLSNINSDQQKNSSAFAEGFCDTIAMLTFDDPRFGLQSRICAGEPGISGVGCVCTGACNCGATRDPTETNVQYPWFFDPNDPNDPNDPFSISPCPDYTIQYDYYCWGQLLSGVWWDIRTSLTLNQTRDLFVSWSSVTAGGVCDFTTGYHVLNSAHPGTLIEVLTIDDDDSNLSNGTPHYLEICRAFRDHRIYLDCLADTNRDGVVNDSDLGIVRSAFGTRLGESNFNPRADFNLDGTVNDEELGCLLSSFGEDCPETEDCPSAVPPTPACGN